MSKIEERTVMLPPAIPPLLKSAQVRLGLMYDRLSKLSAISPSTLRAAMKEVEIITGQLNELSDDLLLLEAQTIEEAA